MGGSRYQFTLPSYLLLRSCACAVQRRLINPWVVSHHGKRPASRCFDTRRGFGYPSPCTSAHSTWATLRDVCLASEHAAFSVFYHILRCRQSVGVPPTAALDLTNRQHSDAERARNECEEAERTLARFLGKAGERGGRRGAARLATGRTRGLKAGERRADLELGLPSSRSVEMGGPVRLA